MSTPTLGENSPLLQGNSTNNCITFDAKAARELRDALNADGLEQASMTTPTGELCRLLGFPGLGEEYPEGGLGNVEVPAFEVRVFSIPQAPTADVELESAVAEAAEHPGRAADLANALGVGSGIRTRPAFISTPSAYLFRPNFGDVLSDECLPFVSGSNHWNIPCGTDGNNERGKRYAAALLLQAARARDGEGLLPQVHFSMAAWARDRGTVITFWSHIQRYLGMLSQYLSPAQIASDLEAVLAEDRELLEETGYPAGQQHTPATPQPPQSEPAHIEDEPERVDISKLLLDLGSRNAEDRVPELTPAPNAVSQCISGSGGALAMPNCFGLTVLNGDYRFPNEQGWKISRGDTLIFETNGDGVGRGYDVFLVYSGGALTLTDGDARSLRDGKSLPNAYVIAPCVQYRPLGQTGGAR